jgi:hypothetical protein
LSQSGGEAKTNTTKGFGYLTSLKPFREIIKHARLEILKPSDVSIGEELLGNTCFAGATTPNYNANLPIIIFNGQGAFEMLLQLDLRQTIVANNTL